MKAQHASDHARSFHRSEAFPEDLADLVEAATVIAATRRRPTGHGRLLMTLLPLAAVAAGTALALSRLFY